MTQEIGFVEPFDKNQPIPFDEFPVGSTLELYQYHSCDTASKYSVISVIIQKSHCSKSSFFVQKFNFDFPRKWLNFFFGEKLLTTLISQEKGVKTPEMLGLVGVSSKLNFWTKV